MKRSKIKGLTWCAVLISAFAFSQNTNSENADVKRNDAATTDSIAVLEAKKKAAADEKNRLPKPYNEKENAAQKIATLVKKAKAESRWKLVHLVFAFQQFCANNTGTEGNRGY